MRYVREPDAITVAVKCNNTYRSFIRTALLLQWMGQPHYQINFISKEIKGVPGNGPSNHQQSQS
jgi:hypothetical protein